MPDPRAIIEAIQRDRGFDPTDDAPGLARSPGGRNQRDLGNALKLLSDQLYNSDGHFLLELLQNADDNAYAPGVEPAVSIEIGPESIVLRNNEVGFSDSNVEALCSVGESTKRTQKSQTTGEKGIGFKAVFKVSDRPEVHSGGYHFCFDRVRYGDLGLVTPRWLEPPTDRPPLRGTTIVLPYKSTYSPNQDLQAQLRPELLLFLRRLRRVRIVDGSKGVTTELRRSGEGSMVEIVRSVSSKGATTSSTCRFFRHARPVRVDDLREELRPEIAHTEVVVAAALSDNGTIEGGVGRHLFAFLPVRESGLRFVAHADFILNTSREDVMRQRPWNLRLRDELGLAVADAVLAIQQDTIAGRTALRMLSKPSGIPDTFIQPILERAIGALAGSACVPVKSGGWSVPEKAIRHDPGTLSELIPPEESATLIGRSLLDDSVSLISEALDLLKIPRFQLADLLKACTASGWMAKRTPNWFADLYRRLEPLAKSDEVTKQLQSAAIIRLGDSSGVTAAHHGVFRSLSRRTTYGFEDQLAILDVAVLHEAKARSWLEAVDAFLARLGVRDADPAAIIDKHIVRTHVESAGKVGIATLLGHGRYLRDHLEQYLKSKGDGRDAALAGLRETIWLLTEKRDGDKRFVKHGSDLYLGDAFGDPNKLQSLLGEWIDADVVATDYLAGDATKATDSWRALFINLGAHTLPRVRRSQVAPSHVSPPPSYRGSPAPTADDWVASAELAGLIGLKDPVRKSAFVSLLDRHWTTHWARYSTCRLSRGYQLTDGSSSLLEAFRVMPVLDSRGEWVPFTGLYQPTENNRVVFGNGVRYLQTPLTSKELVEAIGVVSEPTVEQVLNRLSELSRQSTADRKEVAKLYRFLDEHWEGHEERIAEYFREHSVVCVKCGDGPSWAQSGSCCWMVPSRLREAAPLRGLVGVWPQLEEFFCEKLAVRKSLSREEWVATLLALPDIELEVSEAGELARRVYRELEDLLAAEEIREGEEVPEWFKPVVEGIGVWTTRGEWWRNEGNVYVNDAPDVAELFSDAESLAFFDIPPSDVPRFRTLVTALGLTPVSAAPREPVSHAEHRESPEVASHIRSRWTAIARYLYYRHHALYEQVKSDGRLIALRTLSVTSWMPLLLEVSLNGVQRQHRFECTLQGGGGALELLVDHDERDSWAWIGREIGQYLTLDEDASSFISMVLAAKDESAVEKLMRPYRVYDLPQVERDFLIDGRQLTPPNEESEGQHEDESGFLDEEEDLGASPGQALEERSESGIHGEEEVGDDGSDVADMDVGGSKVAADSDKAPGSSNSATGASTTSNSQMEDRRLPEGMSRAGGTTQSNGDLGRKAAGRATGTHQGSRVGGAAPPISPDRPHSEERKPQRTPGRLISYVEPTETSDRDADGDDAVQAERDRTNLAAVAYVVLKEKEEQRRAEVRDHTNPGYDIESFNVAGESDRYIEVKGLQGAWGERGVTMTATQFAFAQEHRDRAWLYVVEFANDPARRKLWRVRDPAAKVTRFGYDHGWQSVADLAPPPAPAGAALKAGAKWLCDDGVVGTIESVKRSPTFASVRVARPDGTTSSRSGPEEVLARNVVGN